MADIARSVAMPCAVLSKLCSQEARDIGKTSCFRQHIALSKINQKMLLGSKASANDLWVVTGLLQLNFAL
jgi:hypothetical protein